MAGAAESSREGGVSVPEQVQQLVRNVSRTGDFWRRATSIYLTFKGAQLQAFVLSTLGRKSDAELEELVWQPQYQRAGGAMYELCVTLRGFYLKAGQFIGSRNDFVPDAICQRLCLLMDKVPPMSPDQARSAICQELGVEKLSDVFEWIDLDKPLGSASVAQVHKAKLRSFPAPELRRARSQWRAARPAQHVVADGQGVWDICNLYGVSVGELDRLNKGTNLRQLQPGQVVSVPASSSLDAASNAAAAAAAAQGRAGRRRRSSGGATAAARAATAVASVLNAQATGNAPADGLVAVKIQYPNALQAMSLDLKNLRAAAYYLSKTELKFDLVSAIDELNRQIQLEFDFNREARVMDTIAGHLSSVADRIQVPRSVPGLVTRRLLVMHFVKGVPLLDAHRHIQGLSRFKQRQGKRRILTRVSEAYGRMILGEGLFQADGHPGNIMVCEGGRIGLLDYGQSKQLAPHHRLALARLVIELDRGDPTRISSALGALGMVTEKNSVPLRTEMAYGMFDTKGKVDPFDPNSPIKQCAITTFPADLFFVLRVVQLLRGMAHGMGITDFSCAQQWAPLARYALQHSQQADDVRRALSVSSLPAHIGGGPAAYLMNRAGSVLNVVLFPIPQVLGAARHWMVRG